MTKGVRQLVERAMGTAEWEDAGQGWSGRTGELRLKGWSRQRTVVVLRRQLPNTVGVTVPTAEGQGDLFWVEARGAEMWEFAVLVTSLTLEVRSLAQL
jgi:hypothetical protein